MVARPFLECLRTLADCFHVLAFDNPYDLASTKQFEHRRLLAVLSNCIYSRDRLIPDLWTQFMHMVPKLMISPLQIEYEDITSLYQTLEALVFDDYVRRKTVTLNKIIKKGFMMAGINWAQARPPKEVRSYILDLLLELVFLHEEVYNTAKGELDAIMNAVLEKLTMNLLECVKQIDQFGHYGALQALVEVDFVKHTLGRYLSDQANRTFTSIEEILVPFLDHNPDDQYSHNRRQELLANAQAAAAMMFECFS
eukprot:TRINITY_DN3879_c0_g1_i1.p1 TRINITY_DN3879_c0_g1~~TRINITY_DN3879_c0_g1_i1.p1  ORF type:complete len:253 (+),score=65.07 TRINITY_DN3879_c0_g1_i1:157-915(+)